MPETAATVESRQGEPQWPSSMRYEQLQARVTNTQEALRLVRDHLEGARKDQLARVARYESEKVKLTEWLTTYGLQRAARHSAMQWSSLR